MLRRRLLVLPALLLGLCAGVVRAHDERPAPVVDVQIVQNGSTLAVSAHLPIEALATVDLPRTPDRRIDASAAAAPLQLVARDLAQGFDVAQRGEPLPFPTTAARLAGDGASVDVTLTYAMRSDGTPITARFRPFPSIPQPVPVRVQFVASPGDIQVFRVDRAPETLIFNPTLTQTLRQFVRRGAEVVVADFGALLFSLTLVFAWRQQEAVRRHTAIWLTAFLVSATVAIVLGVEASALPVVLGLGASAVVVSALAGIIGASPSVIVPLAALFGLTHGSAAGLAFRAARAYAGAHPTLAFAAFALTIALALLWLMLVLSVLRDAVVRRGLPARPLAIAVLVYACHGALHLVTDEATIIAAATAWNADRLLLAVASLWAGLALVAAVVLRSRQSVA